MLIGRKKEIEQLEKAFDSKKSEFVAIYGRRRIGKTFLVRETFKNGFTFQYTGIYNVPNKVQLQEFHKSLIKQGLGNEEPAPSDWFDAFHLLENLIENSREKRKVIFIDELPWMDRKNSRFLSAFEHFWNGWASARKDVLLLICGSASSWIINKIFRNRGGLYNRVTQRIHLHQFSLKECEALARSLRLPATRNHLMETYMAIGGVPYYWTRLSPRKSLPQNINDLFFKEDAELKGEFRYIYSSMFSNPEKYIMVVEALSGKKSGLTRDEIIAKTGLESNGQLTTILEDLAECGFIRKYCNLNKNVRDALYQLVDLFTLFYYRFIIKAKNSDEEYWLRIMGTHDYNVWCGLAFEKVVLLHVSQIKKALGIGGINANVFSWHVKPTEFHPGTQIDLLIDRADNIIDVCEIKYAPNGYRLTAASLDNLKTKRSVLSRYVSPSKFLELVLITSNGVQQNKYSHEIALTVSGEQLFE